MLVKDMPIARLGKVIRFGDERKCGIELYAMNFGYGLYLKMWPKTGSTDYAALEELEKHNMNWEVELLPETTTITLALDGKSWQCTGKHKAYDYYDDENEKEEI